MSGSTFHFLQVMRFLSGNRRLLWRLSAAMLATVLGLVLVGCGGHGGDGGEGKSSGGKPKYHCPMHPTYVSDRMGDCPICNMKLVPIPGAGADANGHAAAAHSGHGDSAVAKRVVIAISPEKQQRIGLRLATVEKRELARVIRTTGTFEHDETQLARVAPRFGGWIRKLHVNFTGQPVVEGEPLMTVYSPELLAAENDYLVALQRLRAIQGRADDPQSASGRALLESARRRLLLWEVGPEDIAELEARGAPREEAVIRAPRGGHVISKSAVEGQAYMAGETLYEIGSLSPIWLRISLFEHELPFVKTGQTARVTLPYHGRREIEATLDFIYPHIDPVTRRAFARIEVANEDHSIKPEMWAEATLRASAGEVLAAPESALIDTGARWVAFVARDDGHMEPREVEIGLRAEDFIEVRGGLSPGEKVVTRALFLVDAESQLKAAIAAMSQHAGHD
jgi:Cu(I)/Ag(I) efflux system membrane fusion protein